MSRSGLILRFAVSGLKTRPKTPLVSYRTKKLIKRIIERGKTFEGNGKKSNQAALGLAGVYVWLRSLLVDGGETLQCLPEQPRLQPSDCTVDAGCDCRRRRWPWLGDRQPQKAS